ncbi:hypothetical protein TRFO_16380 [Tritrichomonas foetus]|uniref:Uncharacterized protein n=1 Tax=Tritrichomonas foetus TaxID=1144522 RepID=A0A1J4KQ48_9EUKA|nr:hypothetical protein TRFO_16380 [Tritrichomonas foetus]|eukprot:OHT13415.1 hypothetical protein TRFO_16380 [Tritrichomonas foetus]
MFRQISPYEKGLINSNFMVQFALRLESPKYVDETIDKLQKSILGFRLKLVDGNLFQALNNSEINLKKSPTFNTLREILAFSVKNNHPDYQKSFASITANSTDVVVNMNHVVADGGYIKNLIDNFNNLGKSEVSPALPVLPVESLGNYITNADDPSGSNLYLSKLNLKNKKSNPNSPEARMNWFEIEAKDLACYDKNTRKCHALSENVWLAEILSSLAHSDLPQDIPNLIGINTLFDLRPYINPEFYNENKLSILNHFSWLHVLSEFNSEMTIKDLSISLRKSLKQKIKEGEHFSNLKYASPGSSKTMSNNAPKRVEPQAKISNGAICSSSNVGFVVFQKPIEDIAFGSSVPTYRNLTSLLNYSLIDETKEKNTFVGGLSYSYEYVEPKYANLITKSCDFFLRNVTPEMKVENVLQMLKKF